MPAAPTIPILLLAMFCAGMMGYAIQRGATCLVAAVDELVSKRKAYRLVAMLEASVIVAGGLLVARLAGHLMAEPPTFAITAGTLAGGILLGLGAFVARACVFGAIARLGSGEWAYALVPAGFFLGCIVASPILAAAPAMRSDGMSPLFSVASWLMLPLALLALWRTGNGFRQARNHMLADYIWSPHVATGIIGLTFVIMLLTVGPWSYTDLLATAARDMASGIGWKMILFIALLGGAIIGGWTAGRLKMIAPDSRNMARCLAGGALMGAGSVLIPGSNDGLILVGTPLLHGYAWLALAIMAATIACAMLLKSNINRMTMTSQKA